MRGLSWSYSRARTGAAHSDRRAPASTDANQSRVLGRRFAPLRVRVDADVPGRHRRERVIQGRRGITRIGVGRARKEVRADAVRRDAEAAAVVFEGNKDS